MSEASRPVVFSNAFRGRRVLVTGHTGFKGAWLTEWLLSLGAEVVGLALDPDTTPSLFEQLGLAGRIRHVVGDVRSAETVQRVVDEAQPEFLFHLAAQPLVRRSYREPSYTWATNVLGTINVLESLRTVQQPCMAVMITTDKCYENREWIYGYREIDPLGGHDPYSSSKAAAELAIASWRRSFFGAAHPCRVASVRAGNVIGGGDWSEDRIVPDAIRALSRGEPIRVRNPGATRPWQHVLEPLGGYLSIAAALAQKPGDTRLDSAFNIGPDHEANRPVRDLVEAMLTHWSGEWHDESIPNAPHEAGLLHLDNAKIRSTIGWAPRWTFAEAVKRTVSWYRDVHTTSAHTCPRDGTVSDIRAYEAAIVDQSAARSTATSAAQEPCDG
jgi:CDP-glucose 4,6-dehydratase